MKQCNRLQGFRAKILSPSVEKQSQLIQSSGRQYSQQEQSLFSTDLASKWAAKSVMAMLVGVLLLSGCDKQPVDALNGTELSNAVINPVEVDPDKLNTPSELNEDTGSVKVPLSCRNSSIVNAFKTQTSAVQIKGCGEVTTLLPDDNKGSRHQRFIVQLEDVHPTHTVLIAHNIDLAPRIDALKEGDNIVFYGQYEYNQKGGVVHWTHHDPAARHQDGWIEHAGKRFM